MCCTSLAAAHNPLIRTFSCNWSIVDEAGQMLEPVTLGALMVATRFVLVGDHQQLPPLVLSEEAKAQGMDVSLFKRLSERHPEAVSRLAIQYRMNADILTVCNTLFYNQQMSCASDTVATSKLHLPNLAHFNAWWTGLTGHPPPADHWLLQAINPDRAVVFLDTDGLQLLCTDPPTASEAPAPAGSRRSLSSNKTSNVNEVEAKFVRLILQTAVACGLSTAEEAGVISLYRAQIKTLLRELAVPPSVVCELETVDRYQGRDKSLVLLSTVHSAASSESPDSSVLSDSRRINVAVSRAKHKLVLLGSLTVLRAVPAMRGLCELVERR